MREVAVIGIGMNPSASCGRSASHHLGRGRSPHSRTPASTTRWISSRSAACPPASSSARSISPRCWPTSSAWRACRRSRVESACASGGLALRTGFAEVASGLSDVVLVTGVEKMTDVDGADATYALGTAADQEWEGFHGITFPGLYAMLARIHMQKYGTTVASSWRRWRSKNHANGLLNPHAQYHLKVSVEDVLASTMVADPPPPAGLLAGDRWQRPRWSSPPSRPGQGAQRGPAGGQDHRLGPVPPTPITLRQPRATSPSSGGPAGRRAGLRDGRQEARGPARRRGPRLLHDRRDHGHRGHRPLRPGLRCVGGRGRSHLAAGQDPGQPLRRAQIEGPPGGRHRRRAGGGDRQLSSAEKPSNDRWRARTVGLAQNMGGSGGSSIVHILEVVVMESPPDVPGASIPQRYRLEAAKCDRRAKRSTTHRGSMCSKCGGIHL